MHVGSHGVSHGAAHHRLSDRAQMMQREMEPDRPSKGERLVTRLDQDANGGISVDELKDTKLGRRMSVDRFARIDANDDGLLDAGELDVNKRRRHGNHQGPGMIENVVKAQYADYLAEKVDSDDDQTDVASKLIEKLDGDESGALNSEEIAGTRLSKLIGGDFYQIDADKNGALNKAELSGFITGHLLGSSTQSVPAPQLVDEVAPKISLDGAENTATGEANEPLSQATSPETDGINKTNETPAVSQSDIVEAFPSSAASRFESIASAFEAALEILKNGSGSANPYEVVQTLYGDVQKVLEAS